MGMDGGAEMGSADGGARLEDEREDERVEGERKRGVHLVEEREGLFMTTLIDMRGQEFGV